MLTEPQKVTWVWLGTGGSEGTSRGIDLCIVEAKGYCSSMKAEIKALLCGLMIARDRGISRLWIP